MHIETLDATTFSRKGVRERTDLQRLRRDHIEVIAPGLLVISEEFGRRDESRRRIGLLGIDWDANVVVVEFKRSAHGGYMELQALRYAVIVAKMTFEQVADAYAILLEGREQDELAEAALLDFLGWEQPDEDHFG